jgi:DNA polymerase elongation subunit (family B)
MIPESCLIYDIETATNGASFQELDKHKLRFFGAYSYLDNKYYLFNHHQKEEIKELIAKHKFVIGFNNKYYDDPILEHEGVHFDYKTIIDLKKIITQRQMSIKWKNSVLAYHLKDESLNTITRTLELVDNLTAKGDIDYNVLNKEEFTKEELKEIEKYTIRDIEITKKLWEWCFNWFDSWGHLLSKSDQDKLVHIHCSPSVYSYKVICKKAGLKEEYSNLKDKNRFTEGGYVAYPAIEALKGNIFCMDFASLYPHIYIQCNIFGRQKEKGWQGFDCKGFYNTKEMHKISKALHEMYKERKALKKAKDPREYGLKIALNVSYGLLRSSLFKSVYDDIAGNDVCLIGQNWIKLARQRFKEAGYFVFYTDTDSVYIEDKENNKNKLLEITKQIVEEIKSQVPFPVDTFDMDIDYEIDFISFFKGSQTNENEKELDEEDIKNKELGLLKKNYLFSYKKGNKRNVYIKNLGIVKRSNTELSKKIFWEKMKPLILQNYSCKFTNKQIEDWVKEYIEKDISLFARRFTVKKRDIYKVEGCIQVQIYDYIPEGIKNNLGIGTYFLIPNKRLGVGKGFKKYCTLEEYKNNLTYDDLYLDVVMKELHYFNKNYIPFKMSNKKEKIIKFEDTLTQQELW